MMRNNVKKLRVAQGMSQTELCSRVGLSNAYVSQIENDIRRLNQDNIGIFCKALNCNQTELLADEDAPTTETTINHELHQRLIDAISELSPERQLEEIMKIEISADIIKKNRK